MTPTATRGKRNDITSSALRLFAEKGIKATTVRDIAAAAGVTEAALYRHFPGKQELALSLFAEGATRLHDHLQAAAEAEATTLGRLCSLARALFDFARDEPEVYEFVMARHHERVGELPPDQPLPKDVFVWVLGQGMAAEELRPMDPHLAAAMMIGLCLRTIFFMQRGLIEAERDAVLAEVCAALQRMFAVNASMPEGGHCPKR